MTEASAAREVLLLVPAPAFALDVALAFPLALRFCTFCIRALTGPRSTPLPLESLAVPALLVSAAGLGRRGEGAGSGVYTIAKISKGIPLMGINVVLWELAKCESDPRVGQ